MTEVVNSNFMDARSIENERTVTALAIGLFALGTFLRIYHFWGPELWIDEYGTWWMASYGGWEDTIRTTWKIQGDSPFTYLLARVSIEIFGASPFSLRLPSIILGTAALALAYPVGKRLLGSRTAGMMTLALFAVNERLIYFAQEARPYITALFGLMLAFYFYLRLLEKEKLSYRLGYLVGATMAIYAQYLFGFFLIVQALYLFGSRGQDRRLKRWLITFATLALLCLPCIFHLMSLFGKRESLDWVETPNTLLTPFDLLLRMIDTKALTVTALVLFCGLLLRKISFDDNPQRRLGLVLLWLLLPVLVITALPPLFGISLMLPRYVLVSIPALLLLTAAILDVKSRQLLWRWIPVVIFLALSFGWSLFPPFSEKGVFCSRQDEAWSQAVASMEKDLKKEDLVVFWTGFIECDVFAGPDPDPEIVSFVSWPLEANFSRPHDNRMLGLPYNSETPSTQARYRAVVRETTRSRRTWFIGKGAFGPFTAHIVQTHPALRLIKSSQFGDVYVGLVRRGR